MVNGKWENLPAGRMNHFHLIYTPKGLADLKEEVLTPHTRYHVCRELGQGGLHFHIYVETTYDESKLRDDIKKHQAIPQGQKGKKNIHYSNRYVAEHPDGFPDQDLRKFTLGYVCKEEQHVYNKGYTDQEIQEAIDYYHDIVEGNYQKKQEEKRAAETAARTEEKIGQSTIQDRWLEYSVHMMKGINNLTQGVDLLYFKKRAWNYWKKQSNGLFPQQSLQKRFLQSLWAQYLDLREAEVDENDLLQFN